MSDCSIQAMMLKERRTCGTCKHCEPCEWHCDSKESEYSWMVDVDDVDLPCGGYGYEHHSDGLAERYERLARVAREMCKCLASHAYDWTQVAEETADYYREQLEALGVSVDDVG